MTTAGLEQTQNTKPLLTSYCKLNQTTTFKLYNKQQFKLVHQKNDARLTSENQLIVQQFVKEGNILSQVRNCALRGLIARMKCKFALTFLRYELNIFPFVGAMPSCLQ